MSRPFLLVLLSVCCLGPPALRRGSAQETPAPGDNAPGLHQLITEIVRSSIPLEYEDTKHWGGTKEVFDGLKIEREGLKIETRRRRKEVNHGTWKRYRVRVIDPEREFQVRLQNLGTTEDGRVRFDAVFTARLALFGRLSQWQTGVQLISLSAEAQAKVTLRVSCRLGLRFDTSRFPPDAILTPDVTDAKLDLEDFRLRRISRARGPLVKQLSRGLRDVLEEKIEKKQAKLVKDINRQIDKNQDKLRLSLHDALAAQWKRLEAP